MPDPTSDPLRDAIAAVRASVASLKDRVKAKDDADATDHANLTAMIAALEAQIAAGNNDPALLQELSDLKAELDTTEVAPSPDQPPPDNGGGTDTNPTT